MESESATQEVESRETDQTSRLFHVTPLSKYLAMTLFIILPFMGGWIGYSFAPEKVVEVEQVVIREVSPVQNETLDKDSLATTTIDMGEYRVQYDQRVLQLINDRSEVLQSIEVNFTDLDGFSDKDSFVIANRDINYDHYLDVGILTSVGYGGVNRFYHFYTYDPENNQLVLEQSLGQYESAVSNPTFDIENRYLYSNMKSGPDWARKQFIFSDGKYIDEATWVNMHGVQRESVQCETDSDCMLVQPDCEDCEFASIGNTELTEFRNEKQNRCELNPPEVMCDIVFNGEVKCINNSCQLVE